MGYQKGSPEENHLEKEKAGKEQVAMRDCCTFSETEQSYSSEG